ncbi:MAG TPA: aminotransferase class I/II-fold pyridoxal phosphate-dependent enzyme [Spirochaetia bacterium]|nr:aminotransferase class I/II-fold pyridoxal phosphate-dependent enzyme [Spirochaetaceae bacterium]HPE88557.1 aminotransferase class I/II-fold pyridoxal phosphate-dependent enzyme [Spirochaetales bacterium]HRW24496.1 aminotransferase class I/II-fold pyridoxal phosphate-dependent enzyme [Spirochaetia bacterium]
MNALAEELNRSLEGKSAGRLLSRLGRRMYFPKGILSQSAEAGEKAKRFNATVGMAFSHGEPMALDVVLEHLPGLSRREAVAYAPTSGVQATRTAWKAELVKKNPSLSGKPFSLPVVVPGLTAGISYLADLFIEEGDSVVVPDMFWPNYRLIVEERKQARFASYRFFTAEGGFNVAGMEKAAIESSAASKKAVVILNYPNNPTGYTPSVAEAGAIRDALVRLADSGVDVLVILDDAYFGLQYEPDNLRESMFAFLAGAHPRILAAKVDGQTKEDYVWGFRGGFVTFANPALDEKGYDALIKKLMGVVRSSVSNATAPTQHILAKAMAQPRYAEQKARFSEILEGRYKAVKRFIASRPAPEGFKALPFNSGYFMCFECEGFSAEALRLKLLEERGIGVISIQDTWLRVAFSSVDEEDLETMYSEIYEAAASMTRA